MRSAENTARKPAVAEITAVVNVDQFGVFPDGTDATPGVLEALEHCRTNGVSCLVFPPGRYDFYPEFAQDRYLHICNNDEGLKRVVFPVVDFEQFTIDGQGSSFVFHGHVNPFLVSGSSSVTLKGISVDFSRTFHSEGVILGVDDEGMDLHIPEQFPYEVSGGSLRFTGDGKNDPVYGSDHLLEFDTARRETAPGAPDYFFRGASTYPAREIGKRRVRLLIPGLAGTPGNTMVFGPNHRKHPAFVLNRSSDIRMESVTIHHAGGMGVIAQLCHNVHIEGCRVTPSESRIISTTADATHFANCSGILSLIDNLFENQGDDATNIHGVYVQVVRIINTRELLVKLVHPQQFGFDFIEPGLEIEFVHAGSLQTIGEGKVIHKHTLNKELTKVYLDDPVPEDLCVGDALASSGNYPEVRITGNTIRNNRARGMLLNCRGKTRVAGNYFHTAGAAILFEGDASYWFEQGGVRDCVIRDNTFEDCLFGVWGKAVIDVQAGIHSDRESSRYNRNILIRNNRFIRANQLPLVHAFCVDNLQWRENQTAESQTYPAIANPEKPFNLSFCSNVSIEDDLYSE